MKVQGYLLLILCWGISVSFAPGLFAQSVNAQSETAVEMTARLRKEQGLTTEQPVFEQMPVQAGPLMEVSVSGDPVRKGKNDEPAVNLTTETNNPYSETLAEYRVGKPILACRLLKFSAKDQATVVNDLAAYEVEPCKITAEAFKQLPLEMQQFVQQHPTLYIIQ